MCLPLGKALLLGYDNTHSMFLHLRLSRTIRHGLQIDSVGFKTGTGRLHEQDRRPTCLDNSEVSQNQKRMEEWRVWGTPERKAAAVSCAFG